MPSSLEKRFIGNGHFVAGKRAWWVNCSCCGAQKVISTHNRSGLPPNVIIKKLRQAGWQLGSNCDHDLCEVCARKPIASTLEVATKAVTAMMSPVVGNQRVRFSDMLDLAASLTPAEARELIAILRERIPKKTKPKKESEPEYDDRDYEKWLDEQGAEASDQGAGKQSGVS